MKNYIYIITLIMIMVFVACEEIIEGPDTMAKGSFVKRTECNSSRNIIEIGKNLECISYNWENGDLNITHYNAGFNCCPGEFSAVKIFVENGIIILDESKVTGECNCLCLFDVDYKINNLPIGEYEFRVISNVDLFGQKPIAGAKFDLRKMKSGTVCEQRDSYPWNM